MNGADHNQRIEQIATEAAQWLSELENADERKRTAFISWLSTSRQHVEEFFRMAELGAALARVLRPKELKLPPPVVYVVDDDPEIRRALARLLRAAGYSTRSFGSASEFLVSGEAPMSAGCIISEVAMPGLNGLELQQCLIASGRHRPVIFLTGNGDISKAVRAMKAGAVNFLTKPVDSCKLLAAVEEALRIDAVNRREWSARVSISKQLSTLTPRERQVFENVVAGRLNKQIAAELGVAEKTVKVHRARVMRKMHASSLVELVQLATLAGISSISDRLSTLTRRERQVFEQVAAGRLNKQIAVKLGIVEKTIEVHRTRVMRKMHATSLVELLHLATLVGIDSSVMSPEALPRRDFNTQLELA